MTADPSTPEGRAELRRLLGDGHPTDGHALVHVSHITALLDALDEAEREKAELAQMLHQSNIDRMNDVDRWYDQAAQSLSTVTSTPRRNGKNSALRAEKAEAALERVRSYIPTLRALAASTRDADGDYLAHTYDEIATALERKIGDRP